MKVGNLVFGLVLCSVAVWPITAQVPPPPGAQSALAQIDEEASRIADFGTDLHIELALSEPVPWRVFTLDAPRRLVLDFSEVDFEGGNLSEIVHSDVVADLRMGRVQDGWSRLVVELAEPLRIDTAALTPVSGGEAVALKLQLAPTDARAFAGATGAPESVRFTLPAREPFAGEATEGARALRVVLDPGHGGLDRGVSAGGTTEADIVLDFARHLARDLAGAGMEVAMTREGDTHVPLAHRVAQAREADLFLSLHVSSAEEGGATGSTIYTFTEAPTEEDAARLAAGHARADLMAGSDGSWTAATEPAAPMTVAESEALADALVLGLARRSGDLRKRPRLRADFAVLRSPDTPSVLLELGLVSNAADLAKLGDAGWRDGAIAGIREAIVSWDAERSARTELRQ